MAKSEFNKYPYIEFRKEASVFKGWKEIAEEINRRIKELNKSKVIIALECYHGVIEAEIFWELNAAVKFHFTMPTKSIFKKEAEISALIGNDLTEDPVFGRLNEYSLNDYFDPDKFEKARQEIERQKKGPVLVCGAGASTLAQADIIIYADMTRWEIIQRMRRNQIPNLGFENRDDSPAKKYKQAFFFDWRICDRHKRTLFDKWDYYLDTNEPVAPKMITGDTARSAIKQGAAEPFELVPYFDPGPWGGQWMKEICGLDKSVSNYAWCFNCVPEENSVLFKIGGSLIEMPAINIVFYCPEELLGKKVYDIFGAEFPIRFDFLDTMDGGNLSLQVHPTKEYIKQKFNWPYTQDESYYLMDAGTGANVYLGLKEGIVPEDFKRDLLKAEKGETVFPDEKYVEKWPVKKHDHVLIPAGTVHCSGAGCMVLEISSTPYIFTFKLWDWERMGLDGLPRPIHSEHGLNVIQFNRTVEWTRENLINMIEPLAEGDGWREEKTGLHELEFIETRRIWFQKEIEVITGESVNVLNLVEGDEITIEAADGEFQPLTVHYAETFVIPCSVKKYIIRPSAAAKSNTFAVIRAYIR